MLAAAFVYFLKKRCQDFFNRLAGTIDKWSTLSELHFEGINWMYDSTTWLFIEDYRRVTKHYNEKRRRPWRNLFFWIVRRTFTCTSKAYDNNAHYDDPKLKSINCKASVAYGALEASPELFGALSASPAQRMLTPGVISTVHIVRNSALKVRPCFPQNPFVDWNVQQRGMCVSCA